MQSVLYFGKLLLVLLSKRKIRTKNILNIIYKTWHLGMTE